MLWAQVDGDYRTDQTGNWTTPTTWQVFVSGAFRNLEAVAAGAYQNVIPSTSAVPSTGSIAILHNVTVSSAITADQVSITAATTTISGAGVLTIADGVGDDLTLSATGAISVTTGSLVLDPDATYNHARNGGIIPLATWNAGSTCLVTGIVGTAPTLNPLSSYHNFTWNCTGQTGTITLATNLRDVNGDLSIDGTNNQQLQFGTTVAYTLNIDGDFNVSGNSRVAFGTTAAGVVINLLGSFDFSSSAATASSLKSSGTYSMTIGGNFSVNSGLLTMSTGAGAGTINITGDFSQLPSTITETGAGSGVFVFNGTAQQNVSSSGTISNSIDFQVNNAAGIVLNSNFLFAGALTQTLGDIDLNNQVVTLNANFNQIAGTIIISPSAAFVIQGAGTLPASVSFSGTDISRIEMNRAATLTTSNSFTVNTLNLFNGTITHTGVLTMAAGGTIERRAGSITNAPAAVGGYDVLYANIGAINTGSELPISASVLNNLTKQGAGVTTLNQALVTINGNFTTTAGTFACGANSISLAGNYISNAALTTLAGATFTFTGATAVLSGSVIPAFRNLTVTGGLTPSVGYNVSANYAVGVGATVNAGSGTVTFNGTSTVTNNGTMNLNAVSIGAGFTMTAPSSTMGIAGNFTSTGTFNNGGGTILFNGTTDLSAAEIYNNVTVSGTVTSVGNFGQTISGSLINNGSFNIGTGVLTWSGSGTLSGTGSATASDVNVTGTSCTYTSSGNLTLSDDILGTGIFDSSSPTAGTVIFTGTASAISGTGAKTFRNISVTGTLTPAVTYTLANAGGIDVTGTLVSGGTIVFAGTTQTITGTSPSIAFNDVTTNIGSTLTISPNITINGNLVGNGNIVANGTITFVGLTMSGTGTKNFTNVIVGTGTLTPSANYSISGNLTVNGTLAAGNATTTFNGNSAISGAGSTNFNFLTITGTLTSSTGTISILRNFTNNGTFNHNNGTVSFSTAGTVQQQILGSQGIVFNNLVINDVGVATDVTNAIGSGQSVDIAGALSFGEAAAVIDADGAGSSVLRILSTNDSPATDGRIAAITFAGSNVTGNFTVQRYVSSENRIYRYIASPVVGATVAQLKAAIPVTGTFADPSTCTGCISTNPSLFFFNEPTNAYVAFPASGLASASTFISGRGYSSFFRHTGAGAVGTVTINFTGTNPSTAGVTLPVSPTANGFSLVGNPYPSPIVWNNGAGWTKANIGDVIVVRDNATGIHQSYSATAGTGIIAAGQSFWVQSTTAGASLQINENAKTTGVHSFFRTAEPIVDQVELLLTKGTTGTTDNARITIVEGSSALYDSFDGVKFNNSIDDGTTITQVQDISTLSTDATPRSLAVNAIPTITCGQVFNLRVNDFLNPGETIVNYSLTINPSGFMKAISWVLRDNHTGVDVNISSTPNYQFTVDNSIASSKANNRFTLRAASAISIDVSKPVTSTPQLCAGSEAVLTLASQNGVTYGVEINGVYYPNVAQGNGADVPLFIEGDKLTTGTNTIRVKANSGCDHQFLTASVIIDKQAPYEITSTQNGFLCGQGSVTVTAFSPQTDAEYKWYQTQASSVVIATGAQFITPILPDSTTYYVSATSPSGCESERVAVKVSMTKLSRDISIEPTSPVCKGEVLNLVVSSPIAGGSFKWYETASSITSLASTAEFVTPALLATRKYYVSYLSASGCESDRLEVIAPVIDYSPALVAQSQNPIICAGGSHVFKANGAPSGSTYQWFETINSTIPFAEGNELTTNPLSTNTTYYLSAKSEMGCTSNRIPVNAYVDASNPIPSIDYTFGKICNNDRTVVKIANNNPSISNYRWYTTKTDGNYIHDGFELLTETLENQTSYFVSGVNSNGCEGTERKEVVVNVIKYAEPKIEVSQNGLLTSNSANGNQWYRDDELLVGETDREYSPSLPGIYNLKIEQQGCADWASSVFTSTIVTGLEDKPREFSVYPNPVSEVLSIRIEEKEIVSANLLDEKGMLVTPITLRSTVDGWDGELNVKDLRKGLYILQFSSESKRVSHKVIIR
jgi:hypothetical protein